MVMEISPREVRRLSANGALAGLNSGGVLTFEQTDVYRLMRTPRRAGRIWSPRTAWAALEMLSGWQTTLVDQPRRSRLLAKLRSIDAEQFHRLASNRAKVHRFHASERGLTRLVRYLEPTGISGVADEVRARRFGLAAMPVEDRVEGYFQDGLEDLIRRCHLKPDPIGNVTIRTTSDLGIIERALGSVPLIAVDLMDSDEVRERARGRDVLEESLRVL